MLNIQKRIVLAILICALMVLLMASSCGKVALNVTISLFGEPTVDECNLETCSCRVAARFKVNAKLIGFNWDTDTLMKWKVTNLVFERREDLETEDDYVYEFSCTVEPGTYRFELSGVIDSTKDLETDRVFFTVVCECEGCSLHPLTLSSNPPEGGTTTGTGNYYKNKEVTVRAIPNTNWFFVNWTGEFPSATAHFSFTMPDHGVQLTANFEQRSGKPNITFNPEKPATPTADGAQAVVNILSDQMLNRLYLINNGAVANTVESPITKSQTENPEGGTTYEYEEKTDIQQEGPNKLGAQGENENGSSNEIVLDDIVLEFASPPPTTATCADDGYCHVALSIRTSRACTLLISHPFIEVISGRAPGMFDILVTLEEGQNEIAISGVDMLYNNSNELTCAIECVCPRCQLTLSSNPPEGGTTTGAGSFRKNEEVSVVAFPNFPDGWQFVNWTGEFPSANLRNSFTMPDHNVHLTANFEQSSGKTTYRLKGTYGQSQIPQPIDLTRNANGIVEVLNGGVSPNYAQIYVITPGGSATQKTNILASSNYQALAALPEGRNAVQGNSDFGLITNSAGTLENSYGNQWNALPVALYGGTTSGDIWLLAVNPLDTQQKHLEIWNLKTLGLPGIIPMSNKTADIHEINADGNPYDGKGIAAQNDNTIASFDPKDGESEEITTTAPPDGSQLCSLDIVKADQTGTQALVGAKNSTTESGHTGIIDLQGGGTVTDFFQTHPPARQGIRDDFVYVAVADADGNIYVIHSNYPGVQIWEPVD